MNFGIPPFRNHSFDAKNKIQESINRNTKHTQKSCNKLFPLKIDSFNDPLNNQNSSNFPLEKRILNRQNPLIRQNSK